MSEKYLNRTVKFKCICNAVFEIFAPITPNVKINGQPVLLSTDSLICKTTGTCPFCPLPNGQPGPCVHFGKGIFPVKWSDFSKAKLKANGNKVLSDKSTCKCLMGQNISPFGYDRITVSDGVSSVSFSIPAINTNIERADTKKTQSSNSENASVIKPIDNSQSEEIEDTEKYEEMPIEEKCKYALCNYKSCEKVKECKYINTPHSIKNYMHFDGNSSLLKKNMMDETFDNYSIESKEITDTHSPKGEKYTIQHHHMISSRQCYDKVPELVKIGNFYEYNVNNALNGICLPSGGGYNNAADLNERISITFKAMDLIGKQWHVGGHSMRLLINSLTKIEAFVEAELSKDSTSVITGYDQSVTQWLNLILQKNKDRYLDSCRLENYESQKKEFFTLMNRISERIKLHLVNYNADPKNHKWFYISKHALYYAYEDVLKDYKEKIF